LEADLAKSSGPIPLSKPSRAGTELKYLTELVESGDLSSDGRFSKACTELLQSRFAACRVFMVPSCTAALEMAAMLCGCGEGDEVIMPSFTFTSTANAFLRTGARPVFVDIRPDTLNIDDALIERHITPRTKAIVPVHYAGISCQMDLIQDLAQRHGLRVVEDAAQAVNSRYRGRACGTIGDLGAYSFHSTKDYTCGEGGALCVNDPQLIPRTERIRDKGTNRAGFLRGEVDKYTWVDEGSSYLPSELTCACLYGQLEQLNAVKAQRKQIFDRYLTLLRPLEENGMLRLPAVPLECEPNHHLFYILLPTQELRDAIMGHLATQGIRSTFHFIPLHTSPMGQKLGYRAGQLPATEKLSECLLRLPFFTQITEVQQKRVAAAVSDFLEDTCGQMKRMPRMFSRC
jgi:dTDP-4-amino-4,6-dideoxygalactose transaminase